MTKPTKSKAPKETATSVGEQLKGRRLARGLSLKDIEVATRIRGKYLVAIEARDYAQLPPDVYSRGFIHAYAAYVGLDPSKTVDRYLAERGKQEQRRKRAGTGIATPRFALTPRLLTLVGAIIVALGVGGYLIWQLSSLTAAPKLAVTNPNQDQVVYGSLITVNGHVAGGADVFVNDSPILVDGNGNFTDDIALQDGVNSISVSAKNHLGKSSVVTRNILAHLPKTDPASALPTAPFDGVAVKVQTQERATTITVRADGKQVFKGTMLPGTAQTFKGANQITITTTDGGATNLTVTNSAVANKNLGTIGKDGQPKSDFVFAKDTQFQ